ncbi:MAG: hydroxymethylglutaryl-CoA lyase [Candidatus Obscuribacterales bacterium]|nr:hydroxymethylglutaryl-CoA lyase [Candidatus Obscuribacterales bacterium]
MFEKLPGQVTVFEVGPRDGLQNEERFVPTADKVRLIEALASAGLKNIEITSFVSPKWIPQLADGADVAALLKLPADVITSALVPNLKGLDSAHAAGVRKVAVFMSASESHSKRNINKTIDEAVTTLSEVVIAAKEKGHLVRGYLSVVFECPYEGSVDRNQVARLVERLLSMGIDELSLGDTIGAATPGQVATLVKLLSKSVPLEKMALHFHDTRGTALANVVAGLESGVTTFDASIGGMGGCPYAPGAAGNLATEDLIYMLNGLGVKTGVDLNKLVDCGALAQEIIGRQLPGRYLKAALASRDKASCVEAKK